MKLTTKDKAEIQVIADSLPEEELEQIGKEVDDIMERVKVNPLMMAVCHFLPQHFDYPAVEMTDSDDDSYLAAEAFLREEVTKTARRDRALAIFRAKHSAMEAA